jgi:hypothetical protein
VLVYVVGEIAHIVFKVLKNQINGATADGADDEDGNHPLGGE